uniref:Uncharacterized protein LOC100180679 n=1 Tax=Phallusia mammillata TaxID=59560 RepID=A0A6F9DHT7_9ASCI|nr:uncharacterized protein LOC100180679 [Phallusia mammillata]
MEYPGEVCMNPLFADARLYNGLPYHMGGQRVYVSPEDGLRCNNNDTETEGQECYDYQIRFCCKLEPPTCQDHDWSPYFNTDDPSGEGDFEFLFEIQRLYPKAICSSPVWMEARKVNDETMFIDQNVHLNHTKGFQCFNWQNHQSCYDYEVRFCCPGFYPIAECEEKYWTSFFNRDQPDGLGDFETAALIKFDFPEELCKHPTAIQARLPDGLHYLMSNQDIFLNVTEGLICRNDITGGCLDYEVRFCCPKAETPYCPNDAWTPFLDHDDPGLYGDYETLPQLQAIYPELICNKPFAVEARLVNGESYVLGEQDIVLSETGGLRCDNSEDQRCFDYEIRFCCPADNFDPTCPEGVWSGYVSSDDPRGFGDVEEYSEILKIDAEITCIVPYAVQYRTVDPIFRDVKQNVHVEDNRFLCINNDPEGQICVDYEISFCCITVTCVTTITIGPLPCGYTREMCVALGHCWDNKEESCYVF